MPQSHSKEESSGSYDFLKKEHRPKKRRCLLRKALSLSEVSQDPYLIPRLMSGGIPPAWGLSVFVHEAG